MGGRLRERALAGGGWCLLPPAPRTSSPYPTDPVPFEGSGPPGREKVGEMGGGVAGVPSCGVRRGGVVYTGLHHGAAVADSVLGVACASLGHPLIRASRAGIEIGPEPTESPPHPRTSHQPNHPNPTNPPTRRWPRKRTDRPPTHPDPIEVVGPVSPPRLPPTPLTRLPPWPFEDTRGKARSEGGRRGLAGGAGLAMAGWHGGQRLGQGSVSVVWGCPDQRGDTPMAQAGQWSVGRSSGRRLSSRRAPMTASHLGRRTPDPHTNPNPIH